MTAAEDVKRELAEMAKIGLPGTAKAIAYVEANPAEIEDYREGGMRISEICDLVRDLSALRKESR